MLTLRNECDQHERDAKDAGRERSKSNVRSHRGRNYSKIPGSKQDYLVGKSGSPQIFLVVRK